MKTAFKNEDGFVTVMILMLTAAMLILIAVAIRSMYVAHDQNKKDKQAIINKARRLSSNPSSGSRP